MLSQKDKEKLVDEMIRFNDGATVNDFIVEVLELEAELLRIERKTTKIQPYEFSKSRD